LAAAIAAEGLQPSCEIYDRLVHYKSLVPADNAAFQTFALNWWGHQPSINGYWTEREHTRQWDSTSYWQDNGWDYCGIDPNQVDGEIYTEATCARIKAVVDGLIELYFPTGADQRAGDVTGDCAVDSGDLFIMARDWLQSDSIADIYPSPDGDGIVNHLDYAVLAEHWLEGTIP
jgi:hypothetical protein